LEAEGYATRPFIVPACGVDAPHKRDRVWIIARLMEDTSGRRYGNKEEEIRPRRDRTVNASVTSSANVADTDNSGREEQRWPQPAQAKHQAPQRRSWWPTEPSVGRVANGIPRRVDRLKGLGNAIVPQIAMRIAMTIKAIAD
jgi:DNA (cytosine-5)-methyltransferase 1